MENTTQEFATDSLLTQEVNDQITDAVTQEAPTNHEDHTEPQPDQTEPQQEMSELDSLINRRTGFFPVNLGLEDLKWIANACKSNKFSFIGPNEAFMVMNCYLGFSAAVARRTDEMKGESEMSQYVQVQAAALEAAAILLNKYEGSGLESAQRVFRIAVALNTPVMEMKQLDQIINQLKIAEAKQDELASQQAENN
jgi:hypothetical protein